MALKSVVVDIFFEQLGAVLARFEAKYGPLNLVLLTPSHLHRMRWDLVVAAGWMDSLSRLQMIGQLHSFLKAELPDNSRLDGATVHDSSDWLVQQVLSSVQVPALGTAYHIIGLDLGERSSDQVVCLLARPVATHITPEKAA